jgi:hypothetical protein
MQVDATGMLSGWRRAYEAVWSLLPMTREHVTHARSCITAAAVLRYAELSDTTVQRGVVPRWEEHDSGPGLYTKMELLDCVFADAPASGGEIILITGDAVFIWPAARRISVFHHEGTFAHIECHDHAAKLGASTGRGIPSFFHSNITGPLQ